MFNTGPILVKEEDAAIGFYRMAVYYKNYDQLDWLGDYGRSAVFFGSIPSYMYDYCRKEYFILFWTREEADSFIAKYQLRNYGMRYVVITKSNVYDIFGTLK